MKKILITVLLIVISSIVMTACNNERPVETKELVKEITIEPITIDPITIEEIEIEEITIL